LSNYAVILEQVNGDFLDAEAGLHRIRRQIDNRISFLETVLRTGEVVYERVIQPNA
jgi:hypothetical protein